MGEGLLDPLQREARGDQALHAQLRHERQRAAEGGAPAEGAVDADLAEVDVEEIQRQAAALGVDADELERRRSAAPACSASATSSGLPTASQTTSAPRPAGERHHALAQVLAGGIDDHRGAETLARDRAPLLDGIGQDQPLGPAPLGQHHGEEPHDAAADHEHRGVARHLEHLEPGQAAGGGLGRARR